MHLTGEQLVELIRRLPANRVYRYVNVRTEGTLEVIRVVGREGPIEVRRNKPNTDPKVVSLSPEMIWRVAKATYQGRPINLDRVLGGSYNTRSVLEALLAHTPEFYVCRPGRVASTPSFGVKIKAGHKHLMWLPSEPHERGIIVEKAIAQAIEEGHVTQAMVEVPHVADGPGASDVRRHLQIQSLLVQIGSTLGFRSWIAANDRGAIIGDRGQLGELPGVVQTFDEVRMWRGQRDVQEAARLVDCIWFRNGRHIPAIMEVEHSTGVTSGLTRMNRLRGEMPATRTQYVVVAPDEIRAEVFRKAGEDQFRDLCPMYFPYSSVLELADLLERRGFSNGEFGEHLVSCFMEPIGRPAHAQPTVN